jgi:Tfp pilus assembly protein PilV
MSYSICSERGVGLIEVIIAMFLTAMGVLAVFSLQAPAWKTAARADYLGRATEIMQRQLESIETIVMNPCNAVATGTTQETIITSGLGAAVRGDATYNVSTSIISVGTNIWRVSVTVTWPINPTGVTGHVIVSKQEFFRSGC